MPPWGRTSEASGSTRDASHNEPRAVIPLTGKAQRRQIYRVRKKMTVHRGLGLGGEPGVAADDGDRVSAVGDETVLKLDLLMVAKLCERIK